MAKAVKKADTPAKADAKEKKATTKATPTKEKATTKATTKKAATKAPAAKKETKKDTKKETAKTTATKAAAKNTNAKIKNPEAAGKAAPKKAVKTATNRTFTMIKPDAVQAGHIGGILAKINEGGFRIVAMKLTKLTSAKAKEFYAVHKARPFYGELTTFMSSGPIVAAILEKENAVEDFRKLIGATNPAEAEKGTIRQLFAKSVGENAIHGSDSNENAAIECAFHFTKQEMF